MARLRRDHLVFEGGDEAIRDRSGEPKTKRARWDLVLVWYMRLLALLWIAKGLSSWAVIFGVGNPVPPFEARLMGHQATIIYFAVIDPIAAVGLWLATPWGAVVWLTTVVSMAVIELMFPGIYGGSLTVVGLEAVMLGAYLALAWMAARERPP
jgi:hypothetical protein